MKFFVTESTEAAQRPQRILRDLCAISVTSVSPILLGLFLVASAHAADSAALVPLVPPGFAARLVAREPLVRNPCALAFDARGRLFVGQGPQYRNPQPDTPGDTVEILIDADGDGIFDRTKTFARGLNCIQGLAWRGRDLWIGNAPDLTIARDLDGDDEADEYVLVYTDLGNIEHGVHGFNWAPDGKFYFSKGNSKGLNQPGRVAPKPFRELWDLPSPPGAPDFPPPRVFKKGDYQKTYHDPKDDWGRMGGFLRCDDLGANLEIVARGFRNPFDVGFDSGFNWLGTDNDQSEGDRIFMPFFGAHFGWAHAWSASWTGAGHLPTAPVSGPVFTGSGTGIVFADTPGWPAAFRGVWFINDFLHRTTYVYRPRWDGALLQPAGGRWEAFARAGEALFQPIDVRHGPDGALYLTGWGAALGAVFRDGQQVNEGRVFRLAPAGFAPLVWNAAKRAKPVAQWTIAELIDDLCAIVPAWRTDAADELVRRGAAAKPDLIAKLQAGGLPMAQETWALWTLGRIEPRDREIDAWFASTGRVLSPNARLQALRIAAHRIREWQPRAALPAFVPEALADPDARVRFAAVLAIQQARASTFAPALWNLAARETDRVTFYAAWRALEEIAPVAELRTRLVDARGGVRRAALLALLEQGALAPTEVEPLVKDADPDTAGLAALWLAKRTGNSLLVIEPPPGEFTGELRVAITPGLKPSSISYTTDGSEPTPARRSSTARLTIKETTTVKAALFVDGRKVGNTAEATYRRRAGTPAETLALSPPTAPTTLAATLAALPTANSTRGRAVFSAAGCFACHQFDQEGGSFGPDLSAMAARGNPENAIRSILEPNADITEGFALLTVSTRDGSTIAGRLQEETADVLTIMQPDGSRRSIQRAEIAKRESLHTSPMPAFDRVLAARDLADLVAWLMRSGESGPPASGGPAGETSGFATQLADDRLTITDGPGPVATFVFKDKDVLRPAFQNLHAPGGVLVTRRFPPAPPDAVDHATMHPGVWLAFGDINGADFWRNKGRIEHEEFVAAPKTTGDAITFATRSRFIAPGGTALATLHSSFAITRRPDAYLLTWDATIAPLERDLVFGDQEEMGLGVRVTHALIEKNGGTIRNSDGLTGAKNAWGKVADWCAYSGTLDGRAVGAAIFTAPSNPQRPWWHARDYGLMVANSFGKKALPAGADGKLTIKRGETLRLRHGVLLFNAAAAPDFAAEFKSFSDAR